VIDTVIAERRDVPSVQQEELAADDSQSMMKLILSDLLMFRQPWPGRGVTPPVNLP
jgi:hypothetical protein